MEIETLADMTRRQAQLRPDRVAWEFAGRETSFGQFHERSNQVANGLAAAGIGPGQRVAQIGKNSDLFFEIFFGASKTRGALVPVNWRLAPPEISFIINDAQAKVLFVDQDFYEVVEGIQGELTTIREIIALDGGHTEWPSYKDWLAGQSSGEPNSAPEPGDTAVQMYTSGTTGHPKGTETTHENLFWQVHEGAKELGTWSDDDVTQVVLPLFHIGGTAWGLMAFFSGARAIIIGEVDPPEILASIPRDGITKVLYVPAVVLFLLQVPGVEKTDFSSLELIVYGAAPMPLELLEKAMPVFGCDFAQVYGLTETTGAVTFLPPAEHVSQSPRLKSCGKPYSCVELRIVGPDGQELPIGEIGEVATRSVLNMKGYWNLPEDTARAVRGDWFHTGDAGYVDDEGYLYIHDRVKDMIISGGENVYPAEVENVLHQHPEVADAAVIGVPDERWGEAVKAIIVKAPEAELTSEELIAFSRERIAHFKAPKSVDFTAELPRNHSGKILKRELREPYWAGRDKQVV